MARPLKNADHVLARLRKQLTTDNQYYTRDMLAKKTGVSAETLKDIELGKFKLTLDIATRIALGTHADLKSLMNGDDPIMDEYGNVLSPSSLDWEVFGRSLFRSPLVGEAFAQLFEAAWDAAAEKNRSGFFVYLFESWMKTTVEVLGIERNLDEHLLERLRLALFDPFQLEAFAPKDRKLAAEWNALDKEINQKERDFAVELLHADPKANIDGDRHPFMSAGMREAAVEELRKEKAKAKRARGAS